MRIKVDKVINVNHRNLSFRMMPEHGVVDYLPREVCEKFIKLGAIEVPKKESLKKDKAQPAK